MFREASPAALIPIFHEYRSRVGEQQDPGVLANLTVIRENEDKKALYAMGLELETMLDGVAEVFYQHGIPGGIVIADEGLVDGFYTTYFAVYWKPIRVPEDRNGLQKSLLESVSE